jgi:hypothetical protein
MEGRFSFCNTTIKPRQIVIIALLIESNYYLYQQAKLHEQKNKGDDQALIDPDHPPN